MRSIQFLVLLLLCSSCSLMLSCNSSKPKETPILKFNLQKGKAYAYSMKVDIEREMQGQKMNSMMNFDYDVEVIDDKDNIKTLKSTYRKVMMNMKLPQMNVDVDTDRPVSDTIIDKNNPMAFFGNMFHAIVGKSFTLKVDAEGKVLEVTGLKEMGEAMMASMKPDETLRPVIEQAFNSQFNEASMKQNFSQAFNIFPNKPVKVGDSWEKNMTLGGMMPAVVKTVYTVKDIKADKITLDVQSNTEIQNTKSLMTGSMMVDPVTGLVTDADMEQKSEGMSKSTTKIKITGKEK